VTTPAARIRTAIAREIFQKSGGAVQVYFVAFDTSPEKFAFLKDVGGDVIAAGTGADLRTGARRYLHGQDPRRSGRRRGAGTRQEVTSSYGVKGVLSDSSQVLVRVHGADQQGRQRLWEADPVAQIAFTSTIARSSSSRKGAPASSSTAASSSGVTRQVLTNRSHVQKLEAQTKAYLKAGDRATAAKFALELQKAKEELAANEQQLQMHETATATA
jgi:hypothetical protein